MDYERAIRAVIQDARDEAGRSSERSRADTTTIAVMLAGLYRGLEEAAVLISKQISELSTSNPND